MRERRNLWCIFAGVVLFFALTFTASATIIPLDEGGVQSGWSLVVNSADVSKNKVFLPTIFDVDLTGDTVTIQLDKQFKGLIAENLYGPITVWFYKTSATAVSKIIINDEQIINSTSQAWTDFHMELLVNALDPEAAFDDTVVPRGDLLPTVSFDSSPTGYLGKPIVLNFEGGTVSNTLGDNIFNPGHTADESGNPIVILTNADQMAVGDFFGLKEWPTVPEPGTILLLAFGLVGLRPRRH